MRGFVSYPGYVVYSIYDLRVWLRETISSDDSLCIYKVVGRVCDDINFYVWLHSNTY